MYFKCQSWTSKVLMWFFCWLTNRKKQNQGKSNCLTFQSQISYNIQKPFTVVLSEVPQVLRITWIVVCKISQRNANLLSRFSAHKNPQGLSVVQTGFQEAIHFTEGSQKNQVTVNGKDFLPNFQACHLENNNSCV